MPTKGVVSSRRVPVVSREEEEEREAVCWLVTALHVPPSDVEDIVQEVLIAAHRSAHRVVVLEGSTPAAARMAWLRGITLRKVANYRRKRAIHSALELRADVPSGDWHGRATSPSAEDLAGAQATIAMLHECLARLQAEAPAMHAVIVAYELEEMSMADVAALLGISINTAWNRLRLGRQALRAQLAAAAKAPPPGAQRPRTSSAPGAQPRRRPPGSRASS
jgi:RNA polymerase sigma-70 factor (ECF subfamily)